MNKMLYITVALMGLPLYGMEQAQVQAVAKTPSADEASRYVSNAYLGNLHGALIFLRAFPQCVDIVRTPLSEAMNRCLTDHLTNIELCDSAVQRSFEMFAFLLLMGAHPQKNISVIEALTEYRACRNVDQIKNDSLVETWTEKHTLRLRKCATVLLKIVELAEKKDKHMAQEALKAFGIHSGGGSDVPAGYALVKALVEEAVNASESINPEEEVKKQKEKEDREKAMARQIFNDKRIADRKAKEDAKAAANKDKN